MKKILIANRGEIAVRIIRACKEMNIKTVSVYSTADKDSMHVKIADEAICIGPSSSKDSYLNIQSILSAAIVTNATAIHPGYGFLSENPTFIEMVEQHGFIFIGPSSDHVKMMGDKIQAKEAAVKFGLPVIPGSDGEVRTIEEARKVAKDFGYPIIIKASAGGGGRGMKVVHNAEQLEELFHLARTEAETYFNNPAVYIEKFLQNPKHIEVQLIGDKHGNVIHLFERDCSVQRRNQKVIEEALSIGISNKEREEICSLSAKAMQSMGYYSAGTIEYLYEDGKFYFMEMNTRLQVEHPVTEYITGIDLVYEMIRVAHDKTLSVTDQSKVKYHGHSIECRINAEDPFTFAPSPGKITQLHLPAGPGIRIDTAVYNGYSIPPYYDSMIAKLIVLGNNRQHCLLRLERALNELIIEGNGNKTNIELHLKIIKEPDFINGTYSIKWLEAKLEELSKIQE